MKRSALHPKRSAGDLRLIVSPDRADGSLLIHQDANVYAGLIDGDEHAELNVSRGRRIYLHVARGSVTANGAALEAGDALKITDGSPLTLTAGGTPRCWRSICPSDRRSLPY